MRFRTRHAPNQALSRDSMLECRGVTAGYGELTILRDVTISVPQGHVAALLGRNGAGKSTLVKAISGELKLQSGSVLLDGEPIERLPSHARAQLGVASVPEGKRLFRRLTVEENLKVGSTAAGKTPSRVQLREQVQREYARFPVLYEKRRQLAGSLSGGQQQALAIAQALMASPRFLLLDEPSAGLAPKIAAQVMDTVATLRESGVGVLLVEQAIEASRRIADTIIALDEGRVKFISNTTEVSLEEIEDAYVPAHTRRYQVLF